MIIASFVFVKYVIMVWQMRALKIIYRTNDRRVPRSEVLSNMMYVNNDEFSNKYLEISSNLVLAIREK